MNVSCPNLEAGGLEIGSAPAQVEAVIAGVVAKTARPVIAKLTPNVTAISEIARAAEASGACAVTVANTFIGLGVDRNTLTPLLGNGSGGVSGPAIKPLTLQKVRETVAAIEIPVIGCGGICTAGDAVDYFLAGAVAVQVGTATFTRPQAMIDILDELPSLLDQFGVRSHRELVGQLNSIPVEAR